MERYDVWVSTRLYRADNTLFCDLGTMHWPRVSASMKRWLADSCRTTAFWLVKLDEQAGGFTLEYETVVRSAGTDIVVTHVGPIRTEGLSYADVCRFERFAVNELAQMIAMFEEEHARPTLPSRKRSRVGQWAKWIVGAVRARWTA